MRYIVMDLEWNNVYAGKIKGFLNEIIEIGAIMLDENLEYIDEFSSIVRSSIGKKLRGKVRQLTNLTNEDVRSGKPFAAVMHDFGKWIGDGDNVILTWGDGDIRVLIENFRYISGIKTIPFLSNYMDIQKYFQHKMGLPSSHQISLAAASELAEVDEGKFAHHRAFDDSYITAECMKRVFDPDDFFDHVYVCGSSFYRRLEYKPRIISNINNPLVDKSLLDYTCGVCSTHCDLVRDWRLSNQFFRATYVCPCCGRKTRVSVRFKKYFDRLEIRKNVSVINDEKDPENAQKAD